MKEYIVGTIETSYSEEQYMCEYNPQKHSCKEQAVEDFLTEKCFCDAYEITNTRSATANEVGKLEKLLEENKANEDYGLWEAQTEVMYPEHNSVNELIVQMANSSNRNQTINGKDFNSMLNTAGEIKKTDADKETGKKKEPKTQSKNKDNLER